MRDRLNLRTLIQLGLRPEELFQLLPADVRDGAVWITAGKTEASETSVPLAPDLATELASWCATAPGPWLFTGERSAKIDHHNYPNRVLRPIAEKAGLQGVNFQVLRRTCGTLFGEIARDPRLTQRQLRHSEPTVTLRHYQQPIGDAVNSVAEQLERALGFGIPKKPERVN